MNTIQSGMLIGLGFLAAVLLGLLVAPAFWARAVRLTSRRIKDTMPLSEMEIEADRDRIRAEYAIKMHKLETLVEHVKFASARQQIEVNRRDARVNMLEADIERLRASYEEAQNARRVLEQTIADRLPQFENRLTDAKKLLHAREREVGDMTRTAERQARALAEASSINAQQQSEIERLGTSLAALNSRIGESSETDATLKGELEALRIKTREQAQLLARMQSLAGRPVGAQGNGAAGVSREAFDGTATPSASEAELVRQLQAAKARNDEQAAEVARLKAAVAVYDREAEGEGEAKISVRESRVALKARLQSLDAQAAQQSETITKLRSELAAANERQARQASHFTGELRRLGPGAAIGSTGRGRRADVAARSSLADRVAQAQAKSGDLGVDGNPSTDDATPDVPAADGALATTDATADARASATSPSRTDAEPAAASPAPPQPSASRPRLLDRIAGLSRSP